MWSHFLGDTVYIPVLIVNEYVMLVKLTSTHQQPEVHCIPAILHIPVNFEQTKWDCYIDLDTDRTFTVH